MSKKPQHRIFETTGQPIDASGFDVGELVVNEADAKLFTKTTAGVLQELGVGVTDHGSLTSIGTNTHAQIDTHIADTNNPHSVTAAQVGASPTGHTHTLSQVTDSGTMAAVNDAPSDGNQYVRQDAAWSQVSVPVGVHVGDTPPSTPSDGDRWFISSKGVMATYYDDGDSSQWVSENVVPENIASYMSQFKNKVINGNFTTWQRGLTASGSLNWSFGPDRWLLYSPHASSGWDRVYTSGVTGLAGNADSVWTLKITSVSDGNSTWMVQRIEGAEPFHVNSKWTISLRSDVAPSSVNMFKSDAVGGTDSGSFTHVGNNLYVATITLANGSEAQATYLELQIEWPSTATTIHVADIQMEKGPFYTGFEYRPFGVEHALNRRYYERVPWYHSGYDAVAMGVGCCTATTKASMTLLFDHKRTIPSWGGSASQRFSVNGITCTGINVWSRSHNRFWLELVVASGLTVGQAATLDVDFLNGGYISLNSEL